MNAGTGIGVGDDTGNSRVPVSGKRQDYLRNTLIVVAVAGYVFLGLHWLRPLDFVLWLVFSLLAGLPGWAVAVALGGPGCLRRVEYWAGGAVLGWALTSYAILVVGYLSGGIRLWPLWILASVGLIGLVIYLPQSRNSQRVPGENWQKGEMLALAIAMAVVMVFLVRPLSLVGSLTPDGYAFPWLFGFDFTNRVSIAANAAVSLPPNYFHIHGETFHYYMLTYMAPAAYKMFTGGTAEMFSAMIMWCVNLALVFTVLFVWVFRLIVRKPMVLLVSVLTIFVAYSFYWVYVAAKVYACGHPGGFPATVGSGSWMEYSNVSHLLYRYFLVEPQTVLGLALLLLVLGYFLMHRGQLVHWSAGVGVGLVLGLVFGADALLTMWSGLGLGVLALFDLFGAGRSRKASWVAWAAVAIVFAVAAILYYWVGMYSAAGSRSLVVGLHGKFAGIFPVFMAVEFGPLLLLGLIGGWYLLIRDRAAGVVWWVLAAAAAFAVLFVRAQYDDQLGLLKGSRFLFMLLGLAVAVFWQEYAKRPRPRAAYLWCAVLLLAAAPTWMTDWLGTSNTRDRSETVYVYPPDYLACRWIRASLPPGAVVQSSPAYTNYRWTGQPNPYMYPLIANYAERPMAVGCWGMPQMLPDIEDDFYRISADIESMFQATVVDSVTSRLRRYKIDYLYYGPLERMRWPGFGRLLEANSSTFVQVYDHDEVRIYRVVH